MKQLGVLVQFASMATMLSFVPSIDGITEKEMSIIVPILLATNLLGLLMTLPARESRESVREVRLA